MRLLPTDNYPDPDRLQDEGVSLTATPGSSLDGCANSLTKQPEEEAVLASPPRCSPPTAVSPEPAPPRPDSGAGAGAEGGGAVPGESWPQSRPSPDRSTPLLNRHQASLH